MAIPLRVCLFDQTSSPAEHFEQPFRELSDVHIVACCSTWQALQELLHAGPVEAVVVNLDAGERRSALATVQRIAEVAPDCGVVGVSSDDQPDTIIAAMRAGCSQFVRWPIDAGDLRSALERVRQTFAGNAGTCRRICVVGSTGGAGATTVACNLAIELAHVTQQRCALIDMDIQYGDVGCAFDSTPRYSIADVCRAGREIDRTLLEDALDSLPCHVSILTCPSGMDPGLELPQEGVDQMFRVMAQMFPFVVVDAPRYFTPATMVALGGADRVLVVSQLGVPSLRNATRVYEGLMQLEVAEERVEIVLNRCNASFERIKHDEVERHFGRPVFAAIPNDYKRIGSARDLGHPIMSDAPSSPARVAIKNMAQRLATDYLGEENVRRSGGMFNMFRRRRAKTAL